jgi:hypothetical protein
MASDHISRNTITNLPVSLRLMYQQSQLMQALPRCFARPDIFPDPCRLIFNACAAAFCAVDDIRLR